MAILGGVAANSALMSATAAPSAFSAAASMGSPSARPLARIELARALLPGLALRAAARARRPPGRQHVGRHLEGRMRPAELVARALDLVGPQRLAVGGGLALLGRRAVADHGLAGDQRRLVGAARPFDGRPDRRGIVAVDPHRAPARRLEARDLVVGDGKRGRPVDGDRVVVEQHDQLVELEVPGQRDGLVADALHQAAVAGDHIGKVIDDAIAQPRIEKPLGERHADRVGEALAQGTRGRLDARRVAELGMPRRLGAQLPEARQLIHGHAGIAGEMEQRVEQHGAVARRQHEAVAVRPVGRGGIELQEPGEQHGRHVGHAHGHAGMARFGLLHRVHGECPDGIRHVLVRDRAVHAHLHRRIRHARPRLLAFFDRAVGALAGWSAGVHLRARHPWAFPLLFPCSSYRWAGGGSACGRRGC